MKKFLPFLFLTLGSSLLFSDFANAQSCSSGYYPPLSGWASNSNYVAADSYNNYSSCASTHHSSYSSGQATQLPTQHYASSYDSVYPSNSSFASAPVSYGYAPSYVTNHSASYLPASNSYAAPASNYMQGGIAPVQFAPSPAPTCSNGNCRFN